MPRFKNLESAFGWLAMLVLVLLTLSLPVSGGAASADRAAVQPSTGTSVSGRADSAQAPKVPDIPLFEVSQGGVCKADSASAALPDSRPNFGRTCVCSCGYPCKTDADCGGAVGSSHAGISCC